MSNNKAPSPPQAPAKWQLVSRQKKDEQYARIPQEWRLSRLPSSSVTNYLNIPRECGMLSAEELRITEEYDATALADAIKCRTLKCVDVTRAFCKVCKLLSATYMLNWVYREQQ
jgi:amidase